jgi:hypothetical protein
MEKKCFKCGIVKPLTMFYKHKEMADGYLNKCIECTKMDVRLYRIMHPDKLAAYEKKRHRPPESNKSKVWRDKNPEKYKAHLILNNAVRDGKIKKPERCEICDSIGFIHAHHSDYSQPLLVVWICARCHGQIQ